MFKDGIIEGVIEKKLNVYNDDRGWLTELFRGDELPEDNLYPAMSYASLTHPGIIRGPHEHVYQSDYFCFFGPSDFEITLWDNREWSKTYKNKWVMTYGVKNPGIVIVPPGVVHGYKNIGINEGLVINMPNRLFRGKGKKEEVDEIRHEADINSIFKIY